MEEEVDLALFATARVWPPAELGARGGFACRAADCERERRDRLRAGSTACCNSLPPVAFLASTSRL